MSGREAGMVLVQVLGLVGFASAIAVTMLALQERSVEFATKARDSQQAESLALAGEASVLVAFRRDGELHPETDHYGEAWFAASQNLIGLPEGSFSVTIRDAQAKFNLNRLGGGVYDTVLFRRLASANGFPQGTEDRIAVGLASGGELSQFAELSRLGFSPAEMEALAQWATVLPRRAELNLNTASPEIVQGVLVNPASASQLIARRQSGAGLGPRQLSQANVLLPPGTGLVTDYLEVEVQVNSGSETVRLQSLITRQKSEGEVLAYVIRRRWNE